MSKGRAVVEPIPARRIKTRRIEFSYPAEELPRHFMDGGDPVMSHIVAVLSSFFPEGEDFFVRSVRNYRDRIDDPELKKQVAGFIGQEAIHGREHRNFNKRLQKLGYPTWIIDRLVRIGFVGIAGHLLPKRTQVAITAALEHYTATLAETLLGNPDTREMMDVPEVRSMFMWHAIEESEHKSVAFDVYQTVCGKRWLRNLVMDLTTIGFLGATLLGTVFSMLLDGYTYRHPIRTLRSVARLRKSPWIEGEVIHRLRDYNRKGFHPDDHDATALLEEWRAKLFGSDGVLADRLKRSEAVPALA